MVLSGEDRVVLNLYLQMQDSQTKSLQKSHWNDDSYKPHTVSLYFQYEQKLVLKLEFIMCNWVILELSIWYCYKAACYHYSTDCRIHFEA